MRKKYTKALRAHDDTALGEWLCDNFYLLEREGRGVLSQLKTAPALPLDADGVVRIYALCLRAVRDRKSTRLNSSHNVISRMPSSA